MIYKLTLIFVFFFSFIGHSQKLSNYENRKSVRSDNQFVTFHVEDVDKKKKNKKYNTRKEYFWYKSQEVKHTQGGSAGLLLHGLYERFYVNKQIAAKGSFKKGLKHGKWSYWSDEGKIIGFEQYRRGKLIHKEAIDPKTGKPLLVMQRGPFKLRYKTPEKSINTNKDSTKVNVINYDENGSVLSNEKYLFGDLHGKQVYYDKEKKQILKYNKGVLLNAEDTVEINKDSITERVQSNESDNTSKKNKKEDTEEQETDFEAEKEKKRRFNFWPFNRKVKSKEDREDLENKPDEKVED